jgi:hypothetical protein
MDVVVDGRQIVGDGMPFDGGNGAVLVLTCANMARVQIGLAENVMRRNTTGRVVAIVVTHGDAHGRPMRGAELTRGAGMRVGVTVCAA